MAASAMLTNAKEGNGMWRCEITLSRLCGPKTSKCVILIVCELLKFQVLKDV